MCFPASDITVVYAALCEFCRIPSVPTFTPSTAILPADTREIVVSVACPSSIFPVVVIVPRVGLSPEYTILPSVTAVSN